MLPSTPADGVAVRPNDGHHRGWDGPYTVDDGHHRDRQESCGDDDGHRDRARRLAAGVMGSVAVACFGVDDASDDVALDEALLLSSGLAQRGGGEAIEIAHRAGRVLG